MSSDPELTPADPTALAETIRFALRFNKNRKTGTIRDDQEAMSMANRVVEQMRISGYVVFKKPIRTHSTAGPGLPWHSGALGLKR